LRFHNVPFSETADLLIYDGLSSQFFPLVGRRSSPYYLLALADFCSNIAARNEQAILHHHRH
jgi:hypothetical protein